MSNDDIDNLIEQYEEELAANARFYSLHLEAGNLTAEDRKWHAQKCQSIIDIIDGLNGSKG